MSVLFFNLTSCFLIPRFKIKRALSQENCEKLTHHFLGDLSFEDLKKGFDICVRKNHFSEAFEILNQMKDQMHPLVFLEKRASLSLNLGQLEEAIQDYQEILKTQSQNKEIHQKLLKIYIQRNDFENGLKKVTELLNFKFSHKQALELEFIQARLFLLLYEKQKARNAFLSIRKKDPEFFNFKKGNIYLALLSEQDRNFLEAIGELKQTDWKSFEDKILHWENREKNKPK